MAVTTVAKIRRRVRKLVEVRKCFRKMSFLLDNGTYCFKAGRFHLIEPGEKVNPLRRIKVSSADKYHRVYDHGAYIITAEKYTLVFEDRTYQVYKEAEGKYMQTKALIMQYLDRLPYRAVDFCFDDNRCMFVSRTIRRLYDMDNSVIKDEAHFEECLDYLFDALSNVTLTVRQIKTGGSALDVFCCVQHGDCHGKNIIWTEEGIMVIDLEQIGEYPLFYDIIYYVHDYKKETAFTCFGDERFLLRVEETCRRLGIAYHQDLFDLYLAAYVYETVGQINRDTTPVNLHYLMYGFTQADLTDYPLTAEAVRAYDRCLEKYGLRVQ